MLVGEDKDELERLLKNKILSTNLIAFKKIYKLENDSHSSEYNQSSIPALIKLLYPNRELDGIKEIEKIRK